MIDKETWKVGADGDKMEKIIKYNICKYNIIKISFWKRTFSSNVKQFTFFFLGMVALKTPRRNWEIHMDWESNV